MLNNLLKTLPYDTDSFEFGLVQELIYEDLPESATNKEKNADKQTNISKRFTGYVNVLKFVDNTVVPALFMVPLAGRSMFMGGMPEKNSVCFMCNVRGSRIILGFIPTPMNMMIASRHEINDMVEGELLLQGSVYDDAVKDFYSSASAKMDIYGRFIIESGDNEFRVIVGDLLSNEYTPDATFLRDSITGEVVCFSETFKGDRYSRRVDKLGNTIYRTLSALWDIAGDDIRRIQGQFIVSTGEQISLETTGSFITIDKSGISLTSAKDLIAKVVGKVYINSGAYIALSSFLDLTLLSSSSIVLKALKEILVASAGKMSLLSTEDAGIIQAFKDVTVKSETMNALVEAAVNAKMKAGAVATVEGATVKLGSDSASQPVPKGLILQADLISHMHIGNFGYPTSPASGVNPNVFLQILSQKSFTE